MSRLKIRTRILLLLAIPLLALGGLGARYLATINDVKVDGRLYDQVTEPRAIVADVALLAENQAVALIDVEEILDSPSPTQLEALVADLRVREENYLASVDSWSGDRLENEPELAQLLDDAYEPAIEFYRIVNEELVPAIEAEDAEAIGLAGRSARRAYAQQRATTGRVSTEAREAAADREAAAAAALDDRRNRDQILAAGLVVLAIVLGAVVVRSVTRPLRRLEQELPAMADQLRAVDLAAERPEIDPLAVDSHDELAQATRAFNSVVATSIDLAVDQARVRENLGETLQHLGRRNQNLLRRMMAVIGDLEHRERDAESLEELFRLDHIATRMRRNAESLLVLAGSEQPRRWTEPVPVIDVVRSAASEIEDYDRVDLTNLEPVVVQGSSAADISHLLAELIENATIYSPATTRVTVSGRRVPQGYQLAVFDQGLGLDEESLERANGRIRNAAARPDELTDSKLLGLNVVGRLADRHDTRVELAPNPAGGLVALLTLPRAIVARPPTSGGFVPAGTPALPDSAQGPVSVPSPAPGPPSGLPAAPPQAGPTAEPRPATALPATPLAGAPATNDTPPPEAAGGSGLRRRVRTEDAAATPTASAPVHGPSRSAEIVRDSWNRLAVGVRQARLENLQDDQERTQP